MLWRFLLWSSAALLVFIIILLTFPALGLERTRSFPERTAWSMAILIFQLGAGWYFLTSSGFTRGMKIAYTLLSVGILLMGLSQLQLPVITYLDAWNSFYAVSGMVILPYLATSITMYAGMRKLAQLLEVKYLWMNILLVVGFSLVITIVIVVMFLPTQKIGASSAYDALVGWSMAMGVATTAIAYRVKTSLTPTFGPAMKWLLISFVITIIAGLHQLIRQHFIPADSWYRNEGWASWVLLLASIAFLKAGLQFRELSRQLSASANPLDVVMYVIGLVSRPNDIDLILDRLRVLTAATPQDAQLTTSQQKELIQIYLEVEDYLITREPLRKFAKESLRIRLPEQFLDLLHQQASKA